MQNPFLTASKKDLLKFKIHILLYPSKFYIKALDVIYTFICAITISSIISSNDSLSKTIILGLTTIFILASLIYYTSNLPNKVTKLERNIYTYIIRKHPKKKKLFSSESFNPDFDMYLLPELAPEIIHENYFNWNHYTISVLTNCPEKLHIKKANLKAIMAYSTEYRGMNLKEIKNKHTLNTL